MLLLTANSACCLGINAAPAVGFISDSGIANGSRDNAF